jgi:hypothetical protein
MAIALTGLEAGAIAGLEDGITTVGDEHNRAAQNVNELVFMSVPTGVDWTRRPDPAPTD